MDNDIKLGYTVLDLMTGFQGTAYQKIEFLNGNVQFSVMPKCDPDAKKMPDAYNVDASQLKVVDEGIVSISKPPAPTSIELGDEVIDTPSKMKGTVVRRITFINGCIYYDVVAPHTPGEILRDMSGHFLDQTRLQKVSNEPTPTQVQARAVKTPTGGPIEKSYRL